ncbi:MAG: hypothetical protein RI554_10845 [Trueperaceae bacterium]|nr:hypothetical protein [Trueperaceae bacterium]
MTPRRPSRPSARLRPLALAGALLLAASACAPAPVGTATVDVVPSAEAGYYPTAPGSRWIYLPEDAPLDAPRVRMEIEGPTVLDDGVATAWHLEGRGLDVRSYRRHGEDGTLLVREERPGTVVTFDPPIREWPATPLRVGRTWSGDTEATITFPDADAEQRTATFDVQWTYTVVDEREVVVPAGRIPVFVVNFVSRTFDDAGAITETLRQEVWFAPHYGEVRTDHGFFLVESNLARP